jgi:hypothetical protein
MPLTETRWERLGFRALKDVSINDMETAIAEALSRLLTPDAKLAVSIQTLEFSDDWTQPAKIALTVDTARDHD